MPEHPEFLRDVSRGQQVTHDTMNAIIAAVKADLSLPGGFRDSTGAASARPPKTPRRDLWAHAAYGDIPKYAVFGVTGAYDKSNPQRVKVDRVGLCSLGSPNILLTNGPSYITQDTWGTCHVIDDIEAVTVRVTGIIPQVGHPCGVVPDSYGVGAGYHGLICLSNPDANDLISVVRARDPVGTLGIVTATVSAYQPGVGTPEASSSSACDLTPAHGTLGSGIIKIVYRDANGVLVDAIDPYTGEAPWTSVVWNTDRGAIGIGELVTTKSVLGVGLIVDDVVNTDQSSSCDNSIALPGLPYLLGTNMVFPRISISLRHGRLCAEFLDNHTLPMCCEASSSAVESCGCEGGLPSVIPYEFSPYPIGTASAMYIQAGLEYHTGNLTYVLPGVEANGLTWPYGTWQATYDPPGAFGPIVFVLRCNANVYDEPATFELFAHDGAGGSFFGATPVFGSCDCGRYSTPTFGTPFTLVAVGTVGDACADDCTPCPDNTTLPFTVTEGELGILLASGDVTRVAETDPNVAHWRVEGVSIDGHTTSIDVYQYCRPYAQWFAKFDDEDTFRPLSATGTSSSACDELCLESTTAMTDPWSGFTSLWIRVGIPCETPSSSGAGSSSLCFDPTSYNTPGTYDIVAPSNGYICGVAAGSGGGGGSQQGTEAPGAGGGGAAWARVLAHFVTTGQEIRIIVPAVTAAEADGGTARIQLMTGETVDLVILLAEGGDGANGATAGVGGLAINCIGDEAFDGGDGAASTGLNVGSGGGGCGFFTLDAGNDAVTTTGGEVGGANGGALNTDGNPGTQYGGAGSGAGRGNSGKVGGTGFSGVVVYGFTPA